MVCRVARIHVIVARGGLSEVHATLLEVSRHWVSSVSSTKL